MNSELATIEISAPTGRSTSQRRPVRRAAAVLAVVVMGLSACESDPGARRVAVDLIKTAVVDGDLTEAQGDCMLERLDAYSDNQLEDITASAGDAGPGTAIELFETDLATCK